eukprot:934505-Prorocentrum_minimum.AAC.1
MARRRVLARHPKRAPPPWGGPRRGPEIREGADLGAESPPPPVVGVAPELPPGCHGRRVAGLTPVSPRGEPAALSIHMVALNVHYIALIIRPIALNVNPGSDGTVRSLTRAGGGRGGGAIQPRPLG